MLFFCNSFGLVNRVIYLSSINYAELESMIEVKLMPNELKTIR